MIGRAASARPCPVEVELFGFGRSDSGGRFLFLRFLKGAIGGDCLWVGSFRNVGLRGGFGLFMVPFSAADLNGVHLPDIST